MSRCPELLRPGDVLLAGSFAVTPAAVLAHHHASQSRHPARRADPSAYGAAYGVTCPVPLLVAGALDRLRECGAFAGHAASLSVPVPPRLLAEPVIGEPLGCVATVRWRSENPDGGTYLTLAVELHRRRGGVLATLEVGVELGAPARALRRLPSRSGPSPRAA